MRLLTIIIMAISVPAFADASLDGAPSAGTIELLPINAMYKITEPDGTVKFMSENRRFVFVGKMYDLWKGETMTAGVGVSKKIELNRNGVSIEKIAFPVGDGFGENTLFIAPECEDCRGLLELALKTRNNNLNVVLLAASQAGHRDNAFVWCSKNRVKGLRTVYLERKKPEKEDINQDCDRFGLMLAEQAAMVFGIGELPLYVDAEGNGHIGESAIYAVSK